MMCTMLVASVLGRQVDMCRFLLGRAADANAGIGVRSSFQEHNSEGDFDVLTGSTVVLLATLLCFPDMLSLLMDQCPDLDLNAVMGTGETALMLACKSMRRIEILHMLIERFADIDFAIENKKRLDAMAIALRRGNNVAVKLILSFCPDRALLRRYSRNPMFRKSLERIQSRLSTLNEQTPSGTTEVRKYIVFALGDWED